MGDEQVAHAPPSSLHSKLEPPSFAENVKLGLALFVSPDGPESI